MKIKKYLFTIHGDDRGQLVSIEDTKDIPFKIKRVYYMYGTTGETVRGKHAHKNLNQVLICTSGSCKILLDDGDTREVIELNEPNEGLYIANNIWREMFEFSKGSVLMVLASEYYNEDDYIRDYDEFLKSIGKK